jgi:hypothetical protein
MSSSRSSNNNLRHSAADAEQGLSLRDAPTATAELVREDHPLSATVQARCVLPVMAHAIAAEVEDVEAGLVVVPIATNPSLHGDDFTTASNSHNIIIPHFAPGEMAHEVPSIGRNDNTNNNSAAATSADHSTMTNNGRAEFRSVTFVKAQGDTDLGLRVRKTAPDGLIQITSLSSAAGGVLSASPLAIGDFILSINGKYWCCEMEASEVEGLLRAVTGTVTIVAHNVGGDSTMVETMIEKPRPDSIVGLLVNRNARGSLVVHRVRADGMLGHSLLVRAYDCCRCWVPLSCFVVATLDDESWRQCSLA